MTSRKSGAKKRVVISLDNLSEELKEMLKSQYPTGMSEHMIRIDKPNGDFFYGVMLETEESTYLVKLKVKIDQNPGEEFEKDHSDADEGDEIQGADDIADTADDNDD